jgi:hypothetical protein
LKLLSDYPLVTLHFIRTTENLADYLTRQGLPRGDLEKLSLKNVQVLDFYDKLPKEEFSLTEWAAFCADNPQYLTINSNDTHTIKMISYSLDTGIQNLRDQINPILILKERLSRELIIENQQKEFREIYNKTLASADFTYTDKNGNVFKLDLGLLLILKDDEYKIYIPPSMIGLLISYTHLHGHWGVGKMLANMFLFYFEKMYSIIKKFVSCCYSCFLQNSSSRQNVLGVYPVPEFPFQEISMDLCENLNKINGYSHLLIIQDVLSDFLLIFPLKSKTAVEMSRVFLYGVLQNFNIKRIHTDNGPVFRNSSWLRLMATLNITVINSSAQNPAARGKAEKAVHLVKTMLKKMTATSSSGTLNWECLPYLVSKIYNNTVIQRTGYTPTQMIFGKGDLAKSQLSLENNAIPHHSITNDNLKIEALTDSIKQMSKIAHDSLQDLKIEQTDLANKNKIEKSFKENDIVFVIDRYTIPGNSRPLKTKFFGSPCVVIKPYYTTTLVQRIADGFRSLYSNNDLKLFKGGHKLFKFLPKEVQNILLNDFVNLLDSDFETISKLDPLQIPTAISLSDSIEENLSVSLPKLREGRPANAQNDLIEDAKSGEPNFTNAKSGEPEIVSAKSGEPELKLENADTGTEKDHESDSESDEELNIGKNLDPDPDPDSDSETLVGEENENGPKILRSGKQY